MDETLYQPVAESKEACLHNEGPRKEYSYKPLLRQIIVCSGIWNSFFITGLCLGAPTVVIAQIRREANSTEVISDEMASWISSVYGYAALPWFILPVISAKIGRKYPFYMISIIALVSYIVFYFSTTPIHILIAEILQAPQFACQITVSIIIVTEYTSPKYRGLFLTLKSASMNWGMWVANALGTFFHWRTIAVAGIVCASYNLLTTLYWCESPSWLASKHRYEECAKAHRWIKGEDAESEKELEALIRSCKEYQEEQDRKNFRNEENSPHYKNRCSYCCNKCKTIEIRIKNDRNSQKQSYKPLIRQIIVCSGIWNSFFIMGLCLGAPTVTIAQFRKEANSTEAISGEMASWISSVYGYAALPWFILPVLSARIGRKLPFYFVSIIVFISYIMLYFSETPQHILFAEILQSPLFTCSITISIIIVTEYTSPKYRGLFLTLKSASMNWGMWVANALGTFFHWRAIAVAGLVCALYNLLTTLYWCESPSWLASKHRYEECAKVHRWIKGEDAESEKELEALLRSCKEQQEEKNMCQNHRQKFLQRLYRTLLEKAFYKPILLSIGTLSLYHASGKAGRGEEVFKGTLTTGKSDVIDKRDLSLPDFIWMEEK
ncbi:sugar transporter domain-containing protein [Phthorimaea operculella]|nr:sugar transporter domain-containing protein [Phthorimaea operculella]